jgi:hypothetical protein
MDAPLKMRVISKSISHLHVLCLQDVLRKMLLMACGEDCGLHQPQCIHHGGVQEHKLLCQRLPSGAANCAGECLHALSALVKVHQVGRVF